MKKVVNIYGDITEFPYMDGDMSASKLSQEIDGDYDEIVVNISSFGGSVAEGISIYNQLKAHPAKITTVTNGFCCSIASIIFLAGDERKMYDSSIMLIHNAWTACQGNANDLRREADVLEKITDLSVKVYCEKSGLSKDEIKELLDNESWLDSQECLEIGFATEILQEKVEVVSQSVRQSLIDMIMEKCKDDKDKKKKKCQEDDVVKEDDIKEDDVKEEDIKDEEAQKEDEQDKDDKKEDEKKQGAELKAMSSFLNLFN